jgi:hypothetical protein
MESAVSSARCRLQRGKMTSPWGWICTERETEIIRVIEPAKSPLTVFDARAERTRHEDQRKLQRLYRVDTVRAAWASGLKALEGNTAMIVGSVVDGLRLVDSHEHTAFLARRFFQAECTDRHHITIEVHAFTS